MSYEGYFQIICKSGHSSGANCYDEPNFDEPEKVSFEKWRCSKCNELAAWWNLIDVTNGSYYENERIDGYIELELLVAPEMCICNCGHNHPLPGQHATYKIPNTGHKVNL